MKERIQKILAAAGVDSRRNVEQMILQGRIAVNGKVFTRLPVLVDPQKDKVTVDGQSVSIKEPDQGERMYILMNKPKGVLTTNVAQGEQVRAIDLLPKTLPGRVYPVGRLDAESKGLLLLTNDGELTNQLTHPRYGVAKTYRASVDGYVEGSTLEKLSRGVWLGDGSGGSMRSGHSKMKIISRSRVSTVLEITINETRNRELRRMLAHAGHKVRELTRIRMGPLTLDKLAPGEIRALTVKEVRQLQKLVRKKDEPGVPSASPTSELRHKKSPAAK